MSVIPFTRRAEDQALVLDQVARDIGNPAEWRDEAIAHLQAAVAQPNGGKIAVSAAAVEVVLFWLGQLMESGRGRA